MKKFKIQWVYNVIAFLIIIGIVYLASYLLLRIPDALNFFGDLPENVQAGFIAGVIVIIGWFVNSYFARKNEEKRAFEENIRPRKVELYDEFIKFISDVTFNSKDYEKLSDRQRKENDKKIQEFMKITTPKLITFSSNKVIEKWGKWRVFQTLHPDSDTKELMFEMEKLFCEMRRDLGHSGKTQEGDILRLNVNDIDAELKKRKNKNG